MKIPNTRELPNTSESKDFLIIYKEYTAEPYSFLVNDAALPSDNPLRFRKNLLKQNI